MNIFILDTDPVKAAAAHCDKHVVKMILESSQMLSTAVRILDSEFASKNPLLMQIAYSQHPCTIWTRESAANFDWHLSLLESLHKEYESRYMRIHSASYLPRIFHDWYIQHAATKFHPKQKRTPFALCMPDSCKVPDLTSSGCTDTLAVLSYRSYYLTHKSSFAKWHNSEIPDWWQRAQKLLSAHTRGQK